MEDSYNKPIEINSMTKEDKYLYIVDWLNVKAGTNYRASSKSTQLLIDARFSEGYTVDDFITVINEMCAKWMGTDMVKYLHPKKLFGKDFKNYLKENTEVLNNGR